VPTTLGPLSAPPTSRGTYAGISKYSVLERDTWSNDTSRLPPSGPYLVLHPECPV